MPLISFIISIFVVIEVGINNIWENDAFNALVLIGAFSFVISRIVVFILGFFQDGDKE